MRRIGAVSISGWSLEILERHAHRYWITLRESLTFEPFAQVHRVGTAASIKQLTWRSHPTPHYKVVLVGLCRFKIERVKKTTPFLVAQITQLDYLSG